MKCHSLHTNLLALRALSSFLLCPTAQAKGADPARMDGKKSAPAYKQKSGGSSVLKSSTLSMRTDVSTDDARLACQVPSVGQNTNDACDDKRQRRRRGRPGASRAREAWSSTALSVHQSQGGGHRDGLLRHQNGRSVTEVYAT